MQDDVYPTPDDTAIVMYTSGSTGTPKVLIFTIALRTLLKVSLKNLKPINHVINFIRESS